MSRLSATLRLDARLQARNHVYLIVGIAAIALALPLRLLFESQALRFFMPLLALSGVSVTTFFLVGVLLMLERDEGTLDVVLVSPLRPAEYLASKLASLTSLALLESALIVLVAHGAEVSAGWLAVGVGLRAGAVGAVGVAVGVRQRSITGFLLPAIAWTVAFDLPALWYLQVWPSPLLTLWPTWPTLLLAKAAFFPVPTVQIAAALAYGVGVLVVAVGWAWRSLDRFVLRGELAR